MQLMDDCLYDLWEEEKVEMEDILGKAQQPDSLAKRIAQARRKLGAAGDDMLDDEDFDEFEEDDDI